MQTYTPYLYYFRVPIIIHHTMGNVSLPLFVWFIILPFLFTKLFLQMLLFNLMVFFCMIIIFACLLNISLFLIQVVFLLYLPTYSLSISLSLSLSISYYRYINLSVFILFFLIALSSSIAHFIIFLFKSLFWSHKSSLELILIYYVLSNLYLPL